MDSSERRALALPVSILLATLTLRLFYIFHYGFNSDEAQELHVAWSWSRGLLPYRDVFDNHAPLFQILNAPVAALVGEAPRILFDMRLAETFYYLAILVGTCALARRLFGRRVGVWAAVLVGLIPAFFFKSIEYRADVLWAALWVLSLAVLLGGEWTWRRSLCGGLLIGAALCASLKTVLLIGALGAAGLALPFVSGGGLPAPAPRRIGQRLIALSLGIASPPLVVVGCFALEGALGPLLYGTIRHNCVPGLGAWGDPHHRALWFPVALVIVIAGVRRLVRQSPDPGARARLALLSMTAGIYLAAVHLVWPLYTNQDLLPFFPLAGLVATGLLATGWSRAVRSQPAVPQSWVIPLLLTPLALLEIGLILTWEPPWQDGTRPQIRLLTDVLRLTGPSDYVLDQKGETIFRRRPIYLALETITKRRMERGDFPESIPERLVATGTCVTVAAIHRFPPPAQRFLEENYLPVGTLRVAGQFLPEPGPDPGAPVPFEVAIPARYAIVSEEGTASGRLDDVEYAAPRFLAAGRHAFRSSVPGRRLAVIWAQAVEKGFSPFAPTGPSS
jgi:Dolichyl-phosphate-mannose-protein mannosyltransferase